jgi:hypothetical protein
MRVVTNVLSCDKICHGRVLHQGDPLSPMLFFLVMEVLHALVRKADDWSMLKNLSVRAIPFHMSLYEDDVILFLSPAAQDLQTARGIFTIFEGPSRLGCNLNKCKLAPIRCNEDQLQLVVSLFRCPVADFSLMYLGIPLSIKKLSKSALHPCLDKVADKLLPVWKGQLMNQSGRLTLIKTTLSAVPIYTSISISHK